MNNTIPVGINSTGDLCMQAMKRLMHDEGMVLAFNADGNDGVKAILTLDKKVVKTAEGATFAVALRRMTTGMSADYKWMTENG